MNYQITPSLSTHSRLQKSSLLINDLRSSGYIVAQDVVISKSIFSISARFSLFDTDNYDTRQFIYERDILYVYSIPAFYNSGVRYYLITKYNFSKNATLWIKVGQTKYYGVESIGSGLEEIKGDQRTGFSAQLRIKI